MNRRYRSVVLLTRSSWNNPVELSLTGLFQDDRLWSQFGSQSRTQDWYYLLCLHGLDMIKPIEHAHIPAQIRELCLSLHDWTC